jgi:hypothetical protein
MCFWAASYTISIYGRAHVFFSRACKCAMAFFSGVNLSVLMFNKIKATSAVARRLLGLVDNLNEVFGVKLEAARAVCSQITPDLLL